jgi:serine/threonine protein kinase
MLLQGITGKVESGESTMPNDMVRPPLERARLRFVHYELVSGADGTPLQLGRGAMGVTYKALDVDLHCPVALKLISEKYLGDESVRLRFLREARAAVSVRHPNVASAFHLGRAGQNYFYAMEFVEGETLENLVKRSGRLEVKLALEIAMQVAAGLTAVHKQNLVHRDIKPSNIMVSIEEGGAVNAKIIDLGLAKAVHEPGSQTGISIPGGFAGTPEFASPEQFAGVGVDIRSDLYSLGVTLWQMLTGRTPFRGTPPEVMHRHLHAPAPLDQLQGVPQPVTVLLEALMEKDPGRRFQNPAELLQVMSTITGAIDARRKITRQSLKKTPPADSRIKTGRRPPRLGPKKISVARLPVTGSDLFGREDDDLPDSEILVNEMEWRHPSLSLPQLYPSWFKPTLFQFKEEQLDGFDRAYRVTTDGDVLVLLTPGHTHHHASVLLRHRSEGISYLFAGDAVYNQAQLLTGEQAGHTSTTHIR